MAAYNLPPRPVTRAAVRAQMADGTNEIQPASQSEGAGRSRRSQNGIQQAVRRPLAADEARALLRLTLLMAALWMLAVSSGAVLNNGQPPERQKLPLIWFDRILRAVGPLLPIGVLLLRWYATLPPAGTDAAAGPHFGELAVLYISVTVARIGLYALHLLFAPLIGTVRGSGEHAHLVSDHIFLGASLVAIFSGEAHLLAANARRSWTARRRLDQAILAVAAALLAVLFALTCTEMHITARHFHNPVESFWAVVTGLVCFQAPVLYFMHRITT